MSRVGVWPLKIINRGVYPVKWTTLRSWMHRGTDAVHVSVHSLLPGASASPVHALLGEEGHDFAAAPLYPPRGERTLQDSHQLQQARL